MNSNILNNFFPRTANADYLVKNLPTIRKAIGNFFDVSKLFSNYRTFANLGKILCSKPFPTSNNIRFVENIIYSPDYNGADKDELDVMPSEFENAEGCATILF